MEQLEKSLKFCKKYGLLCLHHLVKACHDNYCSPDFAGQVLQ